MTVDPTGSTISLVQNNGIVINVLLNHRSNAAEDLTTVRQMSRRRTESFIRQSATPTGKKALILAPFQTSFEDDIDGITECLHALGFSVDTYEGLDADISLFNGDVLCHYDIVFIATHGGLSYRVSSDSFFNTLTSGTLFTESTWKKVFTGLFSDDFYIDAETFKFDGLFNDYFVNSIDGKLYLASSSLNLTTHFNNSFIFLSACQSGYDIGAGSLLSSMSNRGAGAVLGFDYDVDNEDAKRITNALFGFLGIGLDLQKTISVARKAMNNDPVLSHLKYQPTEAISYRLFNPEAYNLKSTPN